jgi:adenylate kinase
MGRARAKQKKSVVAKKKAAPKNRKRVTRALSRPIKKAGKSVAKKVPDPKPTPRPTPDMSGRSLLPLNILLIGPPGAGKGTQAEKISTTFGIPHLSTGNLFRAAIKAGTELGKRVEPLLATGKLVPDEITIPIVDERLSAPDALKGVLFDGYPRTIPQADALERTFEQLGRKLNKVILIEVPDSTIVARMSGRRSCPKDGSVYHVVANPPKQMGRCDKCGSELVTRPDDLPQTVQGRLDTYTAQTAPLIAYYQPKGVLARVDGKRTPEQVFESIHAELQK